MTGKLRVILEIGNKRKVVAGATDWPGLDRWGTSDDDALAKLEGYLPRYADVANQAGLADEFTQSRTPEVIERVHGSSSTDFWGIAHVPSEIERGPSSSSSAAPLTTSWITPGNWRIGTSDPDFEPP